MLECGCCGCARSWGAETLEAGGILPKQAAVDTESMFYLLDRQPHRCPPSAEASLPVPLLQMPNPLNIGFDYYWACWIAVLLYVPGG